MASIHTAPSLRQASPPEKPERFQCQECPQSFARVEHLTRHSRSHLKERFLKCTFCRKGFYRIDALKRHEQTHAEPRRSALGRGARACLACAIGRRKCSGAHPCTGCQNRAIECRYPETGRPRGGSLPLRHAGEQNVATSDESLLPWTNASESPGGEHEQRHNFAAHPHSGSFNEQETTLPYGSPGAFAPLYAEHDVQMQQQISPGGSGRVPHSLQPMSISQSDMRDADGFGTTIVPEPGQNMMANSNPDLQNLNSTRNPQEADEFSRNWYLDGFTSINWLPENWTPDFPMEDRDGMGSASNEAYPPPTNTAEIASAQGTLNMPITRDRSRRHRIPSLPTSQPAESQNMSSPGSQSTHSGGQYYVDGEGARLPRVRKAPYRIADSAIPLSPNESQLLRRGFMFPNTDEPQGIPSMSTTEDIPLTIYNEILQMFNITCISSTHYAPFQSVSFPSRKVLGRSIHLYIDNFQPIFPFMHPATFNLSSSHWLLILAVASIGNHYMAFQDVEVFIIAMHEFTRRAIQYMIESEDKQKPDELIFTQIMLLNCVGMLYSGDERLTKFAKGYHSKLASFCDMEWTNQTLNINGGVDITGGIDQEWKTWYEGECRRRTGYCIWLLDCMWVFQFQMRPLLSLEDAQVPIPCQEVLWEADSALDWQQLYDPSTPSPSLHSAIQLAYIEKKLQSSMGEFSRILCIHALFRRTWEVEDYFKQPLTLWVPTAEKQKISVIQESTPVRLPGIQTYSKWRNSTCDVLDILHWHANSVIGATSGMEHPTVLHLHLARVVLLTPIRKIVQLAQLMAADDAPNPILDVVGVRKQIQDWALEDQHKSRLAMIHAGVLFWHVRRYSVDAFYEPSSVFLATLALWAFGTFAAHTSDTAKDVESPQESDDSESLFPTSMQLDRPADDELVQLFVKRGASMKANITGVGNLCSAKGPVRVLIEGRKLLLGLKCWRYSQKAIWTLTALIRVCQQESPV